MASIKFFIQTDRNPAGIYVRLIDGRAIDCKAKTKYVINPSNWSKAKGKPSNMKLAEFKELNQHLEDLKTDLLRWYNNSVKAGAIINSLWLKDFVNGSVKSDLLIDHIEYYCNENVSTQNYKESFEANIRLLKRYEEKYGKVTLMNAGYDFINKFTRWCLDLGYNDSSIALNKSMFKRAAKLAKRRGFDVNHEHEYIQYSFGDPEIIYLTFEEIDKLEKFSFPEHLQVYRDWLVLSCEIGQRVSDFIRLDKSNLVVIDGTRCINLTQEKVKKNVTIPLSARAIRIIDKYNGFPPKRTMSLYNDMIKRICREAGLNEMVKASKTKENSHIKVKGEYHKWQVVSTHIGRRSFASNYYGIMPTPIIMAITGHKTERSFLRYIGKSDTTLAMQAVKYFNIS